MLPEKKVTSCPPGGEQQGKESEELRVIWERAWGVSRRKKTRNLKENFRPDAWAGGKKGPQEPKMKTIGRHQGDGGEILEGNPEGKASYSLLKTSQRIIGGKEGREICCLIRRRAMLTSRVRQSKGDEGKIGSISRG